MKERIFIISPLPENEEEEQIPYNKNGNTIATPYYDEHGNTIEPAYQEQSEPAPTIEKHITIIYEAAKPKVITEQSQTIEATSTIPAPEEQIIFPDLPEIQNNTPTYETYQFGKLLPRVYGEGAELPDYSKLLPSYDEIQLSNLLPRIYGQSQSETSQLTSIRNELATMTTAPGTQPGEIQAAA